jgi:hypothetical protein
MVTDGASDRLPPAVPHVIVVGCGHTGLEIITQLAYSWWLAHRGSNERIAITAVDRAAEARCERLLLHSPRLAEACDLVPVQLDVASPRFERAEFLRTGCDGRHPAETIIVSLGDDSLSLSSALALLRRTRDSETQVIVRLDEEAGLNTLVTEARERGESFERLHAVGVLSLVCAPDRLFAGMLGVLGRAIHEEYVAAQRQRGADPAGNPALVEWDRLPADLRRSNLDQAADILRKVRTIGCDVERLTDWDADSFAFTDSEVELMARMEHERWMSARLRAGWAHDPGPRDPALKRNPHLVAWESLPEEVREWNRRTVREMPRFLAGVGLQIVRMSDVSDMASGHAES